MDDFDELTEKFLASDETMGSHKNYSSKDGKVKYQLVGYHDLPAYIKDNEFILRYYRADWPMKQTLLSIFSIHNETLNIWTHLIGFFLFLFLTIYTATKIPDVADMHLLRSITWWPFFTFLGGGMFCMLASSTCHLLSCHSERVSYIILRLDYAGIAALITTSFYPPVYYSFMGYPFFCKLYIGLITLLGIATIIVFFLPMFQSPEYRIFRASLFLGMGLCGIAPILHKLILFWGIHEALLTTGYEILMGIFYGLGALIYAARIPERWMPGKFDIVGHSHQLFHILVVAGMYTHYRAGRIYIKWHDLQG